MQCRYIRSQMLAYIDGDLYPAQCREVERHVAACVECAEELADVREFSGLMREFVVCPGTPYRFEALRICMAEIEPLEELAAFLPKLRINGAIPRAAVSALMMCLLVGANLASLAPRHAYQNMRHAFSNRKEQVREEYLEELDSAYRDTMAAHHADGPEHTA
mgnify:CR=1 FL=1